MKTVILIAGAKRSGKDYSAGILQEKIHSEIYSFADPLKQIIKDTFNISDKKLDDFKNDDVFVKMPDGSVILFREILQNFGTEGMQPVFGDNVWADLAIRKINQTNKIIIIPDFRFNIEYSELAKNFNIITLKIQNENVENSGDMHSSENELKDFKFDYIIDNSEQKPELLNKYLNSFINEKLGKDFE